MVMDVVKQYIGSIPGVRRFYKLTIGDYIERKKRVAIQNRGLAVIELVQSILLSVNVKSFADFGTLLGIIREGRLLSHDLDIDIGVILEEYFDIHCIRQIMENNGFKLWRQYVYEGNIVEESYKFRGLKVDLGYYRISESKSNTWLFYTKPGFRYKKRNEMHIVEMTYSPINELKIININNVKIVVPLNAEQILFEKYGENWRIPDTGWIYWQSPAAKQLDKLGGFITY